MAGLRVTILGCGSSGGVPRIGNVWGDCDPSNPKNRRRRCAILVERHDECGTTRLLVDAGPDLREQLITTPVNMVDGVIITHDHADHSHGLDDLRQIMLHMGRRVDLWLDEATSVSLRRKFSYCFQMPEGSNYPPIIAEHRLVSGAPCVIAGAGSTISVTPFDMDHGDITALGLRIGGFVYAPDVRNFLPESLPLLQNIELLVIDALRYRSHPSHFSLDEALEWIGRLQPHRAVLTNMHIDLDYDEVSKLLPPHVEPAYDGMVLDIPYNPI